jgi:folate-dependent phosphoribosylglycinamide formyltransferase PurN
VAVVISNRGRALIERSQASAYRRGLHRPAFQMAFEYNYAIRDELRRRNVDLVVMAGYAPPSEVLDAYP